MEDSQETHRSCIACVTREGSDMCQNQSCQRMYCDAHKALAKTCCPHPETDGTAKSGTDTA